VSCGCSLFCWLSSFCVLRLSNLFSLSVIVLCLATVHCFVVCLRCVSCDCSLFCCLSSFWVLRLFIIFLSVCFLCLATVQFVFFVCHRSVSSDCSLLFGCLRCVSCDCLLFLCLSLFWVLRMFIIRQNKTAMGSCKTQNDDSQQNNDQPQDTQRRQTTKQ
jgi:hypothetical protein